MLSFEGISRDLLIGRLCSKIFELAHDFRNGWFEPNRISKLRRSLSSPNGTKFAHNKLRTVCYNMLKTFYLTWAWFGTGLWRTNRIMISSMCFCAVLHNKKAQLTQRECTTAVHVWRPTANKCKICKNLYFSAQGHSRSLLSVSIETRVWLPISD